MTDELKPDEITDESLNEAKGLAHPWYLKDADTLVMARCGLLLGFVAEIERLRTERDRLAALVGMATVFQVSPEDRILKVRSRDLDYWIVERWTKDNQGPYRLADDGRWDTSLRAQNHSFPTREAAFAACSRSEEATP